MFANPICLLEWAQRGLLRRAAGHLTGRVLDAGCGRSPYAGLIPCDRYVGMEMSTRKRPDVAGSVMSLPFGSDSFDNLLCLEVIEHVCDPTAALAELHRVLKDGGHLYLTSPQMWYAHYEPFDYYRYTKSGLLHLLTTAGFDILWIRRTGGFWRFLCVRLIETTFRILRVVLFPLAVHNRFRNAVCRFLLAPLNLVGLALVPVLDCFSKRDHLGWAVLARKQGHEDRVGD